MDKKIATLTMAKRAGKLIVGFDQVVKTLETQQAVLLLTASDISAKTDKEVNFLAEKYNVRRISLGATIDELWYLIGKRAGVMSLIEEGFCKPFSE